MMFIFAASFVAPRKLPFTTLILISLLTPLVVAEEKLVFSASDNSPLFTPVREVLRQAYRSLGIEVEVRLYPVLRSLVNSNRGVTDGEVFGDNKIEKDNRNLIRIDVPLREANIYLFSKKENVFSVEHSWESIPDGYIVGHMRGVGFIDAAIEEHGLISDPSDNTEQMFLKLEKGRVHVVVSGMKRASSYLTPDKSNGIVVLEPSVHTSMVYHYLHKKNAYLVPTIASVLETMRASGEIAEIFIETVK